MTTKCTGLRGPTLRAQLSKVRQVEGFDHEIEFPLVSDEECFRLGEVPPNCRKWCSFEIRCERCGAVTGENK